MRVEVQAPKEDAPLIRALAASLRSSDKKAEALRTMLAKALVDPEVRNAFDIFGSDLSEETFAGVFDQERGRGWREVDL